MIAYLCILLVIFSFTSYRQSDKTNNVEVSIEKSERFSEEEINAAVSCLKKRFKDFKGYSLNKIWYDELESNNFAVDYLKNGKGSVKGSKAKNVILLMSNFNVDSSAKNGKNITSTIYNYNWILIRDSETENWKVDVLNSGLWMGDLAEKKLK